MIIAIDPEQGTRVLLYGREALEGIVRTGTPQSMPILTINIDSCSEELDRLVTLIQEVKGRSSFRPSDLFPEFVVDAASFAAAPELLDPVRAALGEIRTHHRTLLPRLQLRFYYAINAAGFATANEELRQASRVAGTPVAYPYTMLTLGHLLYQRLPPALIKPTRCLDLVHGHGPLGRGIVVRCRSLWTKATPRGPAYHSRRMPRLQFGVDRQERLIAFSQHALERICERTVYNWREFGGHGDAFAFVDNCVYFQDCSSERGEPSFAVYNACEPSFSSWGYVEHVLGVQGLPTNDACVTLARTGTVHRYYYLVGYCPVSFHDDVAVATTLLFPGMSRQKGTPEGRLIDSCGLPADEVARMKAQLETQLSMKALADSGDYGLVARHSWFDGRGLRTTARLSSSSGGPRSPEPYCR